MREIDKAAMGQRIRQIRHQVGLRQWELARRLGTTQSAVHKYEHGVVPEPRRLMELARIGETSIEWILTGTHWENGSETRERLTPDLLTTAARFREIEDDERESVDEALRILQAAVHALAENAGGGEDERLAHAEATQGLLESARRIQQAIISKLLLEATSRLDSSTANGEQPQEKPPTPPR